MASVNRGSKQAADFEGDAPGGQRGGAGEGAPDNEGNGAGGIDGTNVGTALRSIYQRTIEEDIPAEMLDLLNKLN